MFCKKCGKHTSTLYLNNTVCQGCYKYFKNGGKVNPTPRAGEIARDSRGFVICHICGRAYRRLGSHIRESHCMTIAQYKQLFGLCSNAKTTEQSYSYMMKGLAYRNKMPQKLLEVGRNTRIKPGQKLRLGKKSRRQECIERSVRYKKT